MSRATNQRNDVFQSCHFCVIFGAASSHRSVVVMVQTVGCVNQTGKGLDSAASVRSRASQPRGQGRLASQRAAGRVARRPKVSSDLQLVMSVIGNLNALNLAHGMSYQLWSKIVQKH